MLILLLSFDISFFDIVKFRLVLLWFVCIIFLICLKGWKIFFNLFGGILMLVFVIWNWICLFFLSGVGGIIFMEIFIDFELVNLIVLLIKLINICLSRVGLVWMNLGIFDLEIRCRFNFLFFVVRCIRVWRLVRKLFKFIVFIFNFNLFVMMWDMLSKLLSKLSRCLLLEWIIESFCFNLWLFLLFNNNFVYFNIEVSGVCNLWFKWVRNLFFVLFFCFILWCFNCLFLILWCIIV